MAHPFIRKAKMLNGKIVTPPPLKDISHLTWQFSEKSMAGAYCYRCSKPLKTLTVQHAYKDSAGQWTMLCTACHKGAKK